ncbi:hypothetical protein KOW79_005541 [Hemibagrus wyckioides]|uniref:Uncharacterized protein n=1 Tax=Hemibagrus wyckioides TaxID=337641 RepID=A0A9D3NZP9_9TELE|nr:hypothetical protein KOW79_005541 [Hemibagrus wyckioides]
MRYTQTVQRVESLRVEFAQNEHRFFRPADADEEEERHRKETWLPFLPELATRRPNCSTFSANCRERMRNSLSVVLKDRAPEAPPPIDAIGEGVYD